MWRVLLTTAELLRQRNDGAADQCIPQSHYAKQLRVLLAELSKALILFSSHRFSKLSRALSFILTVLLLDGLVEEVDIPQSDKLCREVSCDV